MLPPEEEQRLARLWRDHRDRRAFDRLVLENMRLVYKIARRYHRWGDFDDLAGAGFVALVAAVHRFDPERGIKLGTYAGSWITGFILTSIEGQTGMLPRGTTGHVRKVFWRLSQARNAIERRGEVATREAIARELDVPQHAVDLLLPVLFTARLDSRVPGTFQPLVEIIADPSVDIEDELAQAEDSRRRIASLEAAMLKVLTPRERQIITQRFLISEPMKLQEIADVMALSRERVRQLEVLALMELRSALVEGGLECTS